MIKSIFIIIIFYLLIGCVSKNYTKTDKKILDYKSVGSTINTLSAGSPSASVLFLAIDINNYLKFNWGYWSFNYWDWPGAEKYIN